MYLSNWDVISSRGAAGSCSEHKTGIAEHFLTQALQFPLKNLILMYFNFFSQQSKEISIDWTA